MKMRAIALLLTLAMALTAMPGAAFAADVEQEGTDGTELTLPDEADMGQPLDSGTETDGGTEGLTPMPTPTDLRWNKAYDYDSGTLVDKPGSASYRRTESGIYEIKLYRVTDGSAVQLTSSNQEFGESEEPLYGTCDFFGAFSFGYEIEESGSYYFTVQAMGDGVTTSNSEIATSETWTYTAPADQLAVGDLAWGEDMTMTWDLTAGSTDQVREYRMEIYYAATADDTPVFADWQRLDGGTDNFSCQMPSRVLENRGEGWYFFRVKAYSNGIEEIQNSDWSDMSAGYHYTPSKEQMPAPTELQWHVAYDYQEQPYTLPGAISFKRNEYAEGSAYLITLYREGEGEDEQLDNFSFYFSQSDQYSTFYFLDWLTETTNTVAGSYYFTVQAMGDDVTTSDSEVVRSVTWTYNVPETQLAVGDLSWGEDMTMTWALTSGSADQVREYLVEIYYAGSENGEWQPVTQMSPDDLVSSSCQMLSWVLDEYEEGWYFFSVKAYSNDIEEIQNSDWSDMSEGYHYTSPTEQMPAPTELTWHWDYAYDGTATEERGAISFKRNEYAEDSKYLITLYRTDGETEERIGGVTCAFNLDEVYFSTDPFDWSDISTIGSGSYYFTVQALGDGITIADSEIVTSPIWEYIVPETQLAVGNLSWGEDMTMTWALTSGSADDVSMYEVEIYYTATEGGEPEEINTRRVYYGDETYSQIRASLLAEYGAGLYSFRVRAYSANIEACRGSEWSAMSAAYRYNAPTEQLAVGEVAWDGTIAMTWVLTSGSAQDVSEYEVEIYYAATTSDTPELVDWIWLDGVDGPPYQMSGRDLEGYQEGYYYFRVIAYSGDVMNIQSSEWSTMSGGYYYKIPPQLEAPTDLQWHKMRYGDGGAEDTEDLIGGASWRRGTDQAWYNIDLYKDGAFYEGVSLHISSTDTDRYQSTTLLDLIEESGTYYFTVQATGDGINYRDSEVAYSDEWVYTAPEAQLERVTGVTWDKDWMTWDTSANEDHVYEYELAVYFSETAGETPDRVGWTYTSWNSRQLTEHYIERCGPGYYYFQVRALSSDITAFRHGPWSALCGPYNLAEVVEDVESELNDILDSFQDVETDVTPDTIVSAIQNSIDRDSLSAAMAADKNNTGTAGLISQLEEEAGVTSTVAVDSEMAGTFPAEQVTIIGAGLNAAEDKETVTLQIGKADKGIVIPTQYNNTVQFSMKLEGAPGSSDTEGGDSGQELAIPVKIVLPVPENINPAFLVILHYHASTKNYEEIHPYIYQTGSQWYASFTVDRFSNFVLVADSDIPATANVTGTGVQVQMTLTTAQEGGQIVAAAYDEDGRLLGTALLAMDGGTVTADISCDPNKAATVKVFLLGTDSEPVYRAAEASVT